MSHIESQHAKTNFGPILVAVCAVFAVLITAIMFFNTQINAFAQNSAEVNSSKTVTSTTIITGRVITALDGAPVSGAHVAFENYDYTKTYAYAKSTSDGTFTIECPDGVTGRLVCIAQNFDPFYLENFNST